MNKKIRSLGILSLILCFGQVVWGQDLFSLTGKVFTGEEALAYVTVIDVNSAQGTMSDAEGGFMLEGLKNHQVTLQFSAVGYQTLTQEVDLREQGKRVLMVHLKEDRLSLQEIVVSASRYAQDRKEAPVLVQVLGARLFDATQSLALSDGLNFQPGVRVETNCQNCGFTQVRLNGLDGAYSQILINSRAVFSSLNSVYGLDQIPTNIVERVEVVRGGGSALYGSNAIAGTINIITREPLDNSWELSYKQGFMDASVLDQSTHFNTSLVSSDLDKGLTLYGMLRNRGDYDANSDGFSEITHLENQTIGSKAFWKFNTRHKLTLDWSFMHEFRRGGDRLDLAPELTDITEQIEHFTLLSGLSYDLFSQDFKNKYSFYFSAQNTWRDSFYGGLGGGRTPEDSLLARNAFGDTRDVAGVAGVQFIRDIQDNKTLSLGWEGQWNRVQDDIPGYQRAIDQDVKSLGLYGQYEWQLNPRLKVQGGVRLDYTHVDGKYVTGEIRRGSQVDAFVLSPRLTLLYNLGPSWQIRGGYARGFRAPQAFNEDLHISSVGGEPQFVILSENLEKETSDAYTLSVQLNPEKMRFPWSILLEGFHTDLRNPFTLVSTGAVLENGSILEEVQNGEKASVSGINFEINLSPSPNWLLQAGGTWQKTQYSRPQVLFETDETLEGSSQVSTTRFVRTPNVYGFWTMNYKPLKTLNLDLTGTYTGSMQIPRVSNAEGLLEIRESDPFVELHAKVSYTWKLKKHVNLELSAGVQNIFHSYQRDFDRGPQRDSDYVYGPSRPRTLFWGIKIGDLR